VLVFFLVVRIVVRIRCCCCQPSFLCRHDFKKLTLCNRRRRRRRRRRGSGSCCGSPCRTRACSTVTTCGPVAADACTCVAAAARVGSGSSDRTVIVDLDRRQIDIISACLLSSLVGGKKMRRVDVLLTAVGVVAVVVGKGGGRTTTRTRTRTTRTRTGSDHHHRPELLDLYKILLQNYTSPVASLVMEFDPVPCNHFTWRFILHRSGIQTMFFPLTKVLEMLDMGKDGCEPDGPLRLRCCTGSWISSRVPPSPRGSSRNCVVGSSGGSRSICVVGSRSRRDRRDVT